MVGVRERERVKFKSMRDQRLEFSHIFFIFNPITRIDFHDCPKELFHDCRSAPACNRTEIMLNKYKTFSV